METVNSDQIRDRLGEKVLVSEFKSLFEWDGYSFGIARALLGRLGYDGRFYVDEGKRKKYLYSKAANREITFYNQGNDVENFYLEL